MGPSAARLYYEPIPGSPTKTTGVPDKPLHGSRSARRTIPHKTDENILPEGLTMPETRTGVPGKNYRGPRQKLPGFSTNRTGVPDKIYRGPRQAPSENLLQTVGFFVGYGPSPVVVFFVMLCCLTTRRTDLVDGEDDPWGERAWS